MPFGSVFHLRLLYFIGVSNTASVPWVWVKANPLSAGDGGSFSGVSNTASVPWVWVKANPPSAGDGGSDCRNETLLL